MSSKQEALERMLSNFSSVNSSETEVVDNATESGQQKEEEEVIQQDVVETNTEVVNETVVETPVVSQDDDGAHVKTDEPTTTNDQQVEFDLKSWFEKKEEDIYSFLEGKKKDFSKLKPEDLVKMRIKEDHPEWDESDIAIELQDKYGIGLEKKEIDDLMSDEEIAAVKEYNKSIDLKLRTLKTEAKLAKESFESRTADLSNSNPFKLTQEELFEITGLKKQQEEYDAALKQEKQLWEKSVADSVSDLSKISKKVVFEDNGAQVELDVEYQLTDSQKESLTKYLADYIPHPEADKEYLQGEDASIVKKLAHDKALIVFNEQLMKAALKEYGANVRKSIIKNNIINHDDGFVDRVPVTGDVNSDISRVFSQLKQSRPF